MRVLCRYLHEAVVLLAGEPCFHHRLLLSARIGGLIDDAYTHDARDGGCTD